MAETTPAGWDLASTCNDGSPISNIDVGPGETVTCTFTNTKRGLARVVKTVRGTPPSGTQSFCFDLRSGRLGHERRNGPRVSMRHGR